MLIAAMVGSISMAACAYDALPAFPEARIEVPSSSLLGDALKRAPAFVSDFEREAEAARGRVVIVSHMPILSADVFIDPKFVKAPDSSIDFKLIVRNPGMEPVR